MKPIPLRLAKDEVFQFSDGGTDIVLTFRERLPNGALSFVNQSTGRTKPFGAAVFEALVGDGKMVRLSSSDPRKAGIQTETMLLASINQGDGKFSAALRRKARVAAEKLKRAETLEFYVKKWLKRPDVKDSARAVRKLVLEHRDEARERNLDWEPSYSALHRARAAMVSPADPRSFIETYGEHDETKRYPSFVLQLKEQMIRAYWSSPTVGECDAIADFLDAFYKEKSRRSQDGVSCPSPPAYSTLQRWIQKAKCYATVKSKWGVRIANRQLRGRGEAISADAPLEIVIFDHTRVDAWAKIVDEQGSELIYERPWLVYAIDVCTSMVLGAILTFEPPSLLSIMACLKQVVRRKQFLIDRYGYHKGATDGYGKIGTAVVDNGWENVGKSFRASCHAAGIDVEWAPIKTPEYKSICERGFGRFNTSLWHKLESGIPHRPGEQARIAPDPRDMPKFTVEELEKRLWDFIVTILHVEPCSRIHKAPAKAWREGLEMYGRDFMDNIRDLDRLFGGVASCTLTAEGIFHDGHRFHDQAEVSVMLDGLIRYAPARFQRSSVMSSAKVSVAMTWDPTDCSFIDVWDFHRKQYVRLPNCDRRFSSGLDWKHAVRIRRNAEKQNIAFHSDEEKYAARVAFKDSLERKMKDAPFREARKAGRAFHSEYRLASGDVVQRAYAEPSISGMNDIDIPQVFVGAERDGNHIPTKGSKRGAAKSSSKSKRGTRQESTQSTRRSMPKYQDPPQSLHPPLSDRRSTTSGLRKTGSVPHHVLIDPEAMMAAFEAEVRNKGSRK